MNPQKLDDYGDEIVYYIPVGVSQRHLDWLKEQATEYLRGPQPECLDEGAIIRSLIHCAIQEEYAVECSRKHTEEIRARKAAGLPAYPDPYDS